MDPARYDAVPVGITREGFWRVYDGPVDRIADGGWAELAADAGGGERPDRCGGATVQRLMEEGVSVFFPVIHGRTGEDGAIQGLFELAGAAYVGCGVLSSAACLDKTKAKILLEKAGIPQARYLVGDARTLLRGGEQGGGAADALAADAERALGYPCFVKPANCGSSVGVSKCENRDALKKGLRDAARYDQKVLIEEFVAGRDFECSVLGESRPEASAVGEIAVDTGFYDYRAKYVDDGARLIVPADLPLPVAETIRARAVSAFLAMDCAGLARVDFFVRRRDGEVVLNEINTMPGFTEISMYPKLWAAFGLSYPALIDRLIALAEARAGEIARCGAAAVSFAAPQKTAASKRGGAHG
jgi:D-alanine-D-alanine ligase